MKSAMFMEDGVVQLVLTPTSDFEKNALTTFRNKNLSANIFDGTFYKCQGGWDRQRTEEHSLILRVEKETAV